MLRATMHYFVLATAVLLLPIVTPTARAQEQELADHVVLQNPSFDEDFENDGVPDRWDIPETTTVALTGDATHGAKAAVFSDGYVLASQNLYLRNLAGKKLIIHVDVKGTDGAKFGCLAGCFRLRKDGKRTFVYPRLAWDKPLSNDYERITLRYTFPEATEEGRLWIAFYRSNRQGAVWIDHVAATDHDLPPEDQIVLTRIARESSYVAARAKQAAQLFPKAVEDLQRIQSTHEALAERARSDDPAVLAKREELTGDVARDHAFINALAGNAPLIATCSPACERLEPDVPVPTELHRECHTTALRDEYTAFGVLLLNPRPHQVSAMLTLQSTPGLLPPVVRRQAFMETWYKKAKTRLSDPLPLVPVRSGAYQLELGPGAAEKLFILSQATSNASGLQQISANVSVKGVDCAELTARIDVLPTAFPRKPRFEHIQFMYPDQLPAATHPEDVARDLAAHGVSGIEFPYIPNVTFTPEGGIAKNGIVSSQQAVWLEAYGKHLDRLAIFWEGKYKRLPIEGQPDAFLPYTNDDGTLTPQFRRAYAELLAAWLSFAESRGFGPERFLMLADDEPSSREEFKTAPGAEVRRTLELYQLTRETAPDLQIAVTLSDYAGPADVAVLAPEIDAIMPLWPYREKLSRWAPKDYRPREAFRTTILPMLETERRKRGLHIWSYHIDSGKSSPVLKSGRAYPIIAASAGLTGVSTWAYNVGRGSTWDDTDGGLLDYLFVYNGLEDHPLNHALNPAKEIVVPSIRWEAMRLGWQDAQIILAAKDALKKQPNAALNQKLQAILAVPQEWLYAPDDAVLGDVRKLAVDLRLLYARLTSRQ
ncbi:MAG: hypothetical protein HN742_33540 [Lentisphaerae bacterium]|jgi:hypothetical protein|nr:hypothetical protein [Lentisphaerota bacterium]MBT5611275.1 hypothetical protein [Lentisphaerota bacterium]MBT7058408.1 hypothetical protein [Lentisphaerota bacterium]MBT7846843.1 hypothetical protein [Lentisphaerota bacterium]